MSPEDGSPASLASFAGSYPPGASVARKASVNAANQASRSSGSALGHYKETSGTSPTAETGANGLPQQPKQPVRKASLLKRVPVPVWPEADDSDMPTKRVGRLGSLTAVDEVPVPRRTFTPVEHIAPDTPSRNSLTLVNLHLKTGDRSRTESARSNKTEKSSKSGKKRGFIARLTGDESDHTEQSQSTSSASDHTNFGYLGMSGRDDDDDEEGYGEEGVEQIFIDGDLGEFRPSPLTPTFEGLEHTGQGRTSESTAKGVRVAQPPALPTLPSRSSGESLVGAKVNMNPPANPSLPFPSSGGPGRVTPPSSPPSIPLPQIPSTTSLVALNNPSSSSMGHRPPDADASGTRTSRLPRPTST